MGWVGIWYGFSGRLHICLPLPCGQSAGVASIGVPEVGSWVGLIAVMGRVVGLLPVAIQQDNYLEIGG